MESFLPAYHLYRDTYLEKAKSSPDPNRVPFKNCKDSNAFFLKGDLERLYEIANMETEKDDRIKDYEMRLIELGK